MLATWGVTQVSLCNAVLHTEDGKWSPCSYSLWGAQSHRVARTHRHTVTQCQTLTPTLASLTFSPFGGPGAWCEALGRGVSPRPPPGPGRGGVNQERLVGVARFRPAPWVGSRAQGRSTGATFSCPSNTATPPSLSGGRSGGCWEAEGDELRPPSPQLEEWPVCPRPSV